MNATPVQNYGYAQSVIGPTPQVAVGYPPAYPQPMGVPMGPSVMGNSSVMTDHSMMPMAQMPMPMMMPPGGLLMPGQSLVDFDPIQILGRLSAAKVSQWPDFLGKMTGCLSENIYTVYAGDDNNPDVAVEDFNKLFYCKEHSTCSQRMCCNPNMREFNMDMSYKKLKYNSLLNTYGNEWVPFIKVFRPYACTCYCCNRPVIEIDHYADGKKTRLGTIVHEWKCCDHSFLIREGTSEATSFRINGDCCQCSMMCKANCPCAICHEAVFDLYDCRRGDEKKIGQINKVWSGTLQEMFSNADEYTVIFPKKATWKQKILILCCIIFIDYCYFEDPGGGGSRGRRGRGRRR